MQNDKSQNRTILVTGATGAIGSEIVRVLHRHFTREILVSPHFKDGQNAIPSTRNADSVAQNRFLYEHAQTRIIAHFHRNDARAAQLQRETNCELRRADLCDETQIAALFENAGEFFAVIHCAAITENSLLLRQTRARWDEVLRLNCDGAFLVARESLRRLQRGGRLIFLASRVGERGAIGQGAYAASKAATIALMQSAACEGAAQKISVNAICPGVVASAMTQDLGENRQNALAAQSVFGEFGSARAVAATVLWLLSDVGGEISGQVLHCDSRI